MEYKSRKTNRLRNYDYSQNGMYFVTICAKDREELFGEIIGGRMVLNDVGKIVNEIWTQIPMHCSGVYLDEFIIMSNHIHGIIEIVNMICVGTQFIASEKNLNGKKDAINRVPTKTGGITGEYNPSLNPNSLSSIVRWFKGRCSFEIRKKLNPIYFAWQPRFYDRIIRNETELNRIREYIYKNPHNWERDRNNVENIWM